MSRTGWFSMAVFVSACILLLMSQVEVETWSGNVPPPLPGAEAPTERRGMPPPRSANALPRSEGLEVGDVAPPPTLEQFQPDLGDDFRLLCDLSAWEDLPAQPSRAVLVYGGMIKLGEVRDGIFEATISAASGTGRISEPGQQSGVTVTWQPIGSAELSCELSEPPPEQFDVSGHVVGDLDGFVFLSTCNGPQDIDSSGGFFFRVPAGPCRVRVMKRREGRIGWNESTVVVSGETTVDLRAPRETDLRAYTDVELGDAERLLHALCGPPLECQRTPTILELEEEIRDARSVRNAD